MPIDIQYELRLSYLRQLAADDSAEQEWTRTLREYAQGEHPTYLTDRQEEFIGLKAKDTDHLYAHNLCALVIAAVVERLNVTGFSVAPAVDQNEEDVADDPLAKMASAWWEANRMDAKQDELYEAVCRDDEGYLIVDWDGIDDHPRWTINYKFDGTQGVKVHRDPDTDEIAFASKTWKTWDPLEADKTGLTRQTLYFPDRVEKYIQSKDATARFAMVSMDTVQDEGDTTWPIPWTDKDGKPLGIAVVPFTNPGGSEIADLIPIQDLLNKSDLDMIATEDVAGFRMLWAKGVTAHIDSTTGKETDITIAPGTILKFQSEGAALSAIEPVDPRNLIAASQYWIQSAAGITRTPQYLFQAQGAQPPSGESLKMQEIGLVSKVNRKQGVFGNAWEDTLALSAKLWNLYSPGQQLALSRLQTEWDQAGSRDEVAEMAMIEAKQRLSIPLEQLWSEMHYTQEQIDKFKVMKQEEEAAEQKTLAQTMLMTERRFNQGANA